MSGFVQMSFAQAESPQRTRKEIIAAVMKLLEYYAQGELGGERMPEDAHPQLDKSSRDNFHYFTLPMSLNYQRNSYKLWEAALATYSDTETRFVFWPEQVVSLTEADLRHALLKYKLALQPNRHTTTWRTICETLARHHQSDVRDFLAFSNHDIALILSDLQMRKKDFPYLNGRKIANYWLYVMLQYTDAPLFNRCFLSVAPDTHVIQASLALGIIVSSANISNLPLQVAAAWQGLLADTNLCPIDLHTPLWLWSRRNFTPQVYS